METKHRPPLLSLHLQSKQQPQMMQKIMMSAHMQQALYLLQLPLIELEGYIEQQIVQNPILEMEMIKEEGEPAVPEQNSEEQEMNFDEKDLSILSHLEEEWQEHFTGDNMPMKRSQEEEKLKSYQESAICAPMSLYNFLLKQAFETFEGAKDKEIARIIIGYIDSQGFLKTSPEEICLLHDICKEDYFSILKEIKTFEPYGVGAVDIRESLLNQLDCYGKKESLAYQLINSYYQELLHNQLPVIQKKLKCSFEELQKVIDQEVAYLDLHPGARYSSLPAQTILPDVALRLEGEKLIVEVDADSLPPLRLNLRYLKMLRSSQVGEEVKQFVKRHLFSARWLMRNLNQRYSTIERIAAVIAEKQRSFFIDPNGQLHPLTMKSVAQELHLHESTVARTVSSKYMQTPKGLFSMRFFFTNEYFSKEGESLSSQTVKEAVLAIIDQEDKRHPLSDEKISTLLKEQGIVCARRTIAKYRFAADIGNTQQRRKFHLSN